MYNRAIYRFVCSETEPVVTTHAGKVRGYLVNDIYTFHGIPSPGRELPTRRTTATSARQPMTPKFSAISRRRTAIGCRANTASI